MYERVRGSQVLDKDILTAGGAFPIRAMHACSPYIQQACPYLPLPDLWINAPAPLQVVVTVVFVSLLLTHALLMWAWRAVARLKRCKLPELIVFPKWVEAVGSQRGGGG